MQRSAVLKLQCVHLGISLSSLLTAWMKELALFFFLEHYSFKRLSENCLGNHFSSNSKSLLQSIDFAFFNWHSCALLPTDRTVKNCLTRLTLERTIEPQYSRLRE